MILDAIKRLFGMGDPPGHISCQDAMSRIQEFMDGELEPGETEGVEEHFRVCTRCYPHLKLEKEFRQKVREALKKPDVPPSVRQGVLEILAREERGGQG